MTTSTRWVIFKKRTEFCSVNIDDRDNADRCRKNCLHKKNERIHRFFACNRCFVQSQILASRLHQNFVSFYQVVSLFYLNLTKKMYHLAGPTKKKQFTINLSAINNKNCRFSFDNFFQVTAHNIVFFLSFYMVFASSCL